MEKNASHPEGVGGDFNRGSITQWSKRRGVASREDVFNE